MGCTVVTLICEVGESLPYQQQKRIGADRMESKPKYLPQEIHALRKARAMAGKACRGEGAGSAVKAAEEKEEARDRMR